MAGAKKTVKKAAKSTVKKAVKKLGKSAAPEPEQKPENEAAGAPETEGPQPGQRNAWNPEKWKKHFEAYRREKIAHEHEVDDAATQGSKVREKLKKAKGEGIDPDVLVEVYKLSLLPREELQAWFENINQLLVILGIAIPVRTVAPEVTTYTHQIGLFEDGQSIARRVDDAKFEEDNPVKNNVRVNDTQIAAARAQGAKAADKGHGADKNPWAPDLDHPLYAVWEDSRGKRVAEIAAKQFGGGAPEGTAH